MVMDVDFVMVPSVAAMVALVEDVTPDVVTVNLADVVPARMVTDDGTLATVVFEYLSEMAKPPDGAGALKVTVPVADAPPVIDVGETATELRPIGLSVSVVVRELPP
jgi:hypothetical protein